MQGGQTSAASLVRWFCAELGGGLDPAALDAEAAAGVAPGSDGIVALDTWQGGRTRSGTRCAAAPSPGWPSATGARTCTGRCWRGWYGGRQVAEAFAGAGIAASELVLTGGGGRSELWRQIHADVIGRPLLRLDPAQPAALGAAICAAAGAGAFPDLRSGATAMSRVVPGAEPDPANRQAYDAAFRAYQDVARALAR